MAILPAFRARTVSPRAFSSVAFDSFFLMNTLIGRPVNEAALHQHLACLTGRRDTIPKAGERLNAVPQSLFHDQQCFRALTNWCTAGQDASRLPAAAWPLRTYWNLLTEAHVLDVRVSSRIQRSRYKMTTRAAKPAAAEEIAAIEDLMADLEKRLRRLSSNAQKEASGATGEVGDFVSETLERIMERVRDSASGLTESVTDEATRLGGDALKKFTDEIEHRPLMMLGIAAGIGFLAGLANRR